VPLHLIEPLGFEMDDRRLRRAGLDYHEFASVKAWSSLDGYQHIFPERRLVAIETSGHAYHTDFKFQSGDTLVLGSETKGLPSEVLDRLAPTQVIRLPMVSGNRSMNLSNAAAVVVYEAWRQLGHAGADN
jgi:tRNA (cytidine(34)-2'-O)-methyltransferase